jgi:hypothetical protein
VEKVFPKPEKEAAQSWEMLVETLIKRAIHTVLHAAEEQGIESFYEAIGKYTEALDARILRELHVISARNGVSGVLRKALTEVLQWREISRGRELALSRSFKTFWAIQEAATQFFQKRTSRSEPCSQGLARFHTDLINSLWEIYEECLRSQKRATPPERNAFLNCVHEAISKISSEYGTPTLSIPQGNS